MSNGEAIVALIEVVLERREWLWQVGMIILALKLTEQEKAEVERRWQEAFALTYRHPSGDALAMNEAVLTKLYRKEASWSGAEDVSLDHRMNRGGEPTALLDGTVPVEPRGSQ